MENIAIVTGGSSGIGRAAARDLTRALMTGMTGFYPYAAQLFPGLTEEEYRTARPREVVEVMRAVVQHTMEVLQGVQAEGDGKNPQGRRSPSTRRSSTSKSR